MGANSIRLSGFDRLDAYRPRGADAIQRCEKSCARSPPAVDDLLSTFSCYHTMFLGNWTIVNQQPWAAPE